MKYNDILKMNHQKEIDYLLSEMKSKNHEENRRITKFNNEISKQNGNEFIHAYTKNIFNGDKKFNILIEKNKIAKNFEQNITQNPSDRTERKFLFTNHIGSLGILQKQSNKILNEGNNKIQEKKKRWKEHLNNFYNYCDNKQSIELSNFKKLTIFKNNLKNNNDSKLEKFDQPNQVADIQPQQNELFANGSLNKNNSLQDKHSKVLLESMIQTKSLNPLKITIRELICAFLTCNKIERKQNIFKNAEEKFNNNMDVLTYQRKMLEIDIIKFLILDKNLLEIMNFISKPSVSIEKNQKIIEEEIYEFFDSESAKNNKFCMYKIKNAYSKLQRLESKNPYVQERILKLFKNQIYELEV